jgi:hypothetical protein
MIPDATGNLNALCQMLILFRLVQLELVRFH